MILLTVSLFWGSIAAAGPYRTVREAELAHDHRRLAQLLDHRRSYVRERAAHGLRGVSPTDPTRERLRTCVADPQERDWVRAACGGTLARWADAAAVPLIIEALDQVGPESRYWLAEALSHFQNADARATLEGLRGDEDLLLATAARGWTP